MNEAETDAARATARLGQVLRGKYRLDRVLGVGGMAAVYAATHRNGMEVAVKILHADLASRPDIRARFLREGLAANALRHPGAVKVVDDDVSEDGSAFLVMELLRGEPLDAVWERCGRVLPMGTVLAIGSQLCDVLAAAHKAGIVHRDLKPQNLFLTVDGALKVLDFGIARLREASSVSATDTGTTLGTPTFMSPEQAAGDTRKVGPQSDLYSVGATLFTLASGEYVHEGENAQQIVVRTATAPARSLAAVIPGAPRPLIDVVDRAIAFDPGARWASAEEMRDALRVAHLEVLGVAVPASIPLPRLTGLAWFRHTSKPPSGPSNTATPVTVGGSPVSFPIGSPPAAAHDVASGASTTRPLPPARSRVRALSGLLGVCVAVLGVAVFLGLRARGSEEPGATRTLATAASGPGDPPVLPSSVPAAMAAYKAGVQAEHDANREVAEASFLEAVAADPGMGAAHLRYAISALMREKGGIAHTHFSKATGLRATLGAVDAALLDAFEPLFDRQPPDWPETERRLDAASKRMPKETQLLNYLTKIRLQQNELDAAIEAADRALALDPRHAGALFAKQVALHKRGDTEGVVRVADQCLEAAPQAAACLTLQMDSYSYLGRCKEVERDAQRLISINPEGPGGFFSLAQAGFALGQAPDGVLESLKMEWKNQGDDAAWSEAGDRSCLAALTGDAPALERALDAMDRISDEGRDAWQHMNAAWTRAETFTEFGSPDRAAEVARAFLERRSAWQEDPGLDLQAIAFDVLPMMSKVAQLGGKVSKEEFERRRDGWVSSWKARLSPGMHGYLWIYGHAQTATTPDEARAALAALPPYLPLPPERQLFIADAAIGHVYVMAGKPAEAVPFLQGASSRCDVFEDPFAYVHASLWLGEALAETGKKDEACRAYDRVIHAWSGFGAKSVTLREARAKALALACVLGK